MSYHPLVDAPPCTEHTTPYFCGAAEVRCALCDLIEMRQQRDKAEYDRRYAIGAIKALLKDLREDDSRSDGGEADGR